MRTIQQMIQSEVMCCMSAMVSTLCNPSGFRMSDRTGGDQGMRDLIELCEQAFELASPVSDYEEAALQADWQFVEDDGEHFAWKGGTRADPEQETAFCDTLEEAAREACEMGNIEPYDREVFEHWAVTDWLAVNLIAHGEKVDKDFAGLCVWARTTTGQAIHADGVIERIYAETHS